MNLSHRRRRLALVWTTAVLALLTGCATPGAGPGAGGSALASATPAAPVTEVLGTGTVMDVDGRVELCMGAVAESYPPQCSGIPLEEWDWTGLEGAESAGGATWGAYAVQGVYDGRTLTVTRPPLLLALYDPMMREDPTGGRPGTGSEDELLTIQATLAAVLGDAYLSSWPADGWLHVQVVWDDGALQAAADADYGVDRVVIESALAIVVG